MTINLPPRRELPAEVKERMRPVFADQRRRNHTPLAVAAGVALLIAGGAVMTRSGTGDHSIDPAGGRVTAPSAHDLARCRAAFGDQSWLSAEMVGFEGRKMLIGKDSRFCELTRSQAFVVDQALAPVRMEAGTLSYVSDQFVAGIPPLGAVKTRAREATGTYSRSSKDSVTTPDFFVAYLPTKLNVTELVFDDRTVPLPQGMTLPRSQATDSFESGNGDPTTNQNRLARCLDASVSTMPAANEPGWRAVGSGGFDGTGPTGVVVARQDGHPRRYGVCQANSVGSTGSGNFSTGELGDKPSLVGIINLSGNERQLIVGQAHLQGRTIELSAPGWPPVTATVAEGLFVAAMPGSMTVNDPSTNGQIMRAVTAVVRGEDNSVLYSGQLLVIVAG